MSLREAIGPEAVHLCVDMQRLFSGDAPWGYPWFRRIVPAIVPLVAHDPAQTVFTRFIPARRPGEGQGQWRRYYQRWAEITVERLGHGQLQLAEPLGRYAPPAAVVDKHVYSPWPEGRLHAHLRQRGVSTLIVSGGETDVCVLATVLGTIDFGYRVIIAEDALCSSSDEAHDALQLLFHRRFSEQIETAPVGEIVDSWRPGRGR